MGEGKREKVLRAAKKERATVLEKERENRPRGKGQVRKRTSEKEVGKCWNDQERKKEGIINKRGMVRKKLLKGKYLTWKYWDLANIKLIKCLS